MQIFSKRRPQGRPAHPDVLTPAEWRVLEQLRAGHTNQEIAQRLGVSQNTVKTHVSSMLAKLGMEHRHQLAVWRGEPMAPVPNRWRSPLVAPFGWLASKGAGIAVAMMGVAAAGAFIIAMESGILSGGNDSIPPAASPVPPEITSTPESPGIVTLAELDVPAGRIVYQCGDGWCLTEADASSVVPLDTLPAASFLVPSPDGAFVAYFEHEGDQRWLGIARIDGTDVRRLAETRPLHDPVPPVWSPDGSTIYVEQGTPPGTIGIGGDTGILAVDVATGDARVLVEAEGFSGGPQVSPDGSMIAYMHAGPTSGGDSDIRVIPAAGGDSLIVAGDGTLNISPAWLSDDRIVFVGWREGNSGSYNLYTIAGDGSDLSASWLVNHPGPDIVLPVGHFVPPVSPDGEWVAFQSDRSGALELYVTRADGSEVRQVSVGADGTAGVPTWSPDSAFLAFPAAIGGKQGIWITRIEDGATAYLAPGSWPAWLP